MLGCVECPKMSAFPENRRKFLYEQCFSNLGHLVLNLSSFSRWDPFHAGQGKKQSSGHNECVLCLHIPDQDSRKEETLGRSLADWEMTYNVLKTRFYGSPVPKSVPYSVLEKPKTVAFRAVLHSNDTERRKFPSFCTNTGRETARFAVREFSLSRSACH